MFFRASRSLRARAPALPVNLALDNKKLGNLSQKCEKFRSNNRDECRFTAELVKNFTGTFIAPAIALYDRAAAGRALNKAAFSEKRLLTSIGELGHSGRA